MRVAGAVVEVKSSLESAADEPGMMAQGLANGRNQPCQAGQPGRWPRQGFIGRAARGAWWPDEKAAPVEADKQPDEEPKTGKQANRSGLFPLENRKLLSDFNGGRTRTRTLDPLIKSQLLSR